MGKTLYLDCTNGISGDMTVAALLDLGAREDVLRSVLDSLPVDGYRIEISRIAKSGLDACDFNVILDREHENHDHDMAYLHGNTKSTPTIITAMFTAVRPTWMRSSTRPTSRRERGSWRTVSSRFSPKPRPRPTACRSTRCIFTRLEP